MLNRNNALRSLVMILALAGVVLGVQAARKTKDTTADAGLAARVSGQAITLAEVDAKALAADPAPYQALFEARRAALDEMIAERLVAAEAATRKISVDALVEAEITKKIVPVTDADVQAFFQENQARMGGRTLDQVSGQIKEFLAAQNDQKVRGEFIKGLKKKSDVQVILDPPRAQVEISAEDPSRGPVDAPIQIVEFSEFQCPFCSRVGPTVKQVLETYGDRVRLVFRDYPLPFHDNAAGAAEAAQCANDQNKFWEYHDKLFANQSALGKDALKKYAVELGLNAETFNTCVDSGRYKQEVDDDYAAGQKLGVRGTPAFFINGRFINGAQPFEAFKVVIDEELERKGLEVPAS